MKLFLALLMKERSHIIRDKRTLIILVLMPIALLMIFGFAITNEIKSADIAILDLAKDEASRKLKDELISSDYFKLNSELKTYDEIHEKYKSGEIQIAIVIPNDFEKMIVNGEQPKLQVIADGSDPNTASTLISYLNSIIVNSNLSGVDTQLSNFGIKTTSRMIYNEQLKSVHLFVPGLITILLMLVSAMMTSLSLAREKETGTLELMLVSPLKPLVFIAAKITPFAGLSLLNALIILVLGKVVFDVPIRGELWLIALVTVIFIITALSLGMLISSIASSQQTALLLSLVGLMLPTILLSDFIFPIDNMPLVLQYFAKLNPATWFMEIIRGLMLKGLSFKEILKPITILVLMTVFFAFVSIKKFKLRLE